jgi:hypothetical protein
VKCYRFDEVQAALRKHWGLELRRGGDMGDGQHDGRWSVEYSRTGFVVGGEFPGHGHTYRRYETLAVVARAFELATVIQGSREMQK